MTLIASILSWIPPWIVGAAIMIVPALIVLVIYRWFTRRLIRLAGRFSPFLQRLLSRGQGPASVIVLVMALGIALPAADFPGPVTLAIGRALLVGFVLALGWTAAIALDIGVEIYLRRFRTDTEDNLLARKHVTQNSHFAAGGQNAAGDHDRRSGADDPGLRQAVRSEPLRVGRSGGADSRLGGAAGAQQPARRGPDCDDAGEPGRGPGGGGG